VISTKISERSKTVLLEKTAVRAKSTVFHNQKAQPLLITLIHYFSTKQSTTAHMKSTDYSKPFFSGNIKAYDVYPQQSPPFIIIR